MHANSGQEDRSTVSSIRDWRFLAALLFFCLLLASGFVCSGCSSLLRSQSVWLIRAKHPSFQRQHHPFLRDSSRADGVDCNTRGDIHPYSTGLGRARHLQSGMELRLGSDVLLYVRTQRRASLKGDCSKTPFNGTKFFLYLV